MNRGKPKRTDCNRCGTTVRYRYGAKPAYCEDCEAVFHRRSHR